MAIEPPASQQSQLRGSGYACTGKALPVVQNRKYRFESSDCPNNNRYEYNLRGRLLYPPPIPIITHQRADSRCAGEKLVELIGRDVLHP